MRLKLKQKRKNWLNSDTKVICYSMSTLKPPNMSLGRLFEFFLSYYCCTRGILWHLKKCLQYILVDSLWASISAVHVLIILVLLLPLTVHSLTHVVLRAFSRASSKTRLSEPRAYWVPIPVATWLLDYKSGLDVLCVPKFLCWRLHHVSSVWWYESWWNI
jgi:hypothetical protein